MDLASQLDPDGGMPGQNTEQRVTRSIALLYAMISHGHGPETGAFRLHVARLIEFLEHLLNLGAKEKKIVQQAIDAASTGRVPAGDWLKIAQRIVVFWDVVATGP